MPRYPFLTSGQQPLQPGEGTEANQGTIASYALGGSALAASGFVPLGRKRAWDYYLSGIRAIESGSPGGILKTFRISESLSPLESWDEIKVPKQVTRGAGKYSSFLTGAFGRSQSYTLKRSGLIFGEVFDETGKVIGLGIQIEAGSQKGAAIADYYARISGVNLGKNEALNDALLRSEHRASKSKLPYEEWLKTIEPAERRPPTPAF